MPVFEPLFAFLKQTVLWRNILNILAPRKKTLRFALIYPGTVISKTLPTGSGFGWEPLGIANVGTVAFNPSKVQVSVVLGNNNWPAALDVMAFYVSGPYVLNPGEVSGGMSWGLSMADIQSGIPEVTAISPITKFYLSTRIFNNSGLDGSASSRRQPI
jgi:hypothetical protein